MNSKKPNLTSSASHKQKGRKYITFGAVCSCGFCPTLGYCKISLYFQTHQDIGSELPAYFILRYIINSHWTDFCMALRSIVSARITPSLSYIAYSPILSQWPALPCQVLRTLGHVPHFGVPQEGCWGPPFTFYTLWIAYYSPNNPNYLCYRHPSVSSRPIPGL